MFIALAIMFFYMIFVCLVFLKLEPLRFSIVWGIVPELAQPTILTEVSVTPNEPVKAGDPLYRFDDNVFRLQVEGARTQLAAAEQNVRIMADRRRLRCRRSRYGQAWISHGAAGAISSAGAERRHPTGRARPLGRDGHRGPGLSLRRSRRSGDLYGDGQELRVSAPDQHPALLARQFYPTARHLTELISVEPKGRA